MSAMRLVFVAIVATLLVHPGCGSDGVIDLSPSQTDGGLTEGAAGGPAEGGWTCSNDGQCAPPLAHCSQEKQACVECLTDTNCAEGVCEPTTNACVACVGNQDCEHDKICDTSRWLCVACINNAGCTEEGTACDTIRGECAETCGSDAECTEESGPRCHVASGFCVQCLTPDDCESGETCDVATHQCD